MTERRFDASVMVKAVVAEDLSNLAADLIKETQDEGLSLIAPFLLEPAVTSTLSKKVKDGIVTVDEAKLALTIFQSILIDYRHFSILGQRAFELAVKYNWRFAYDGFYIALAEHEGCELWTADEEMVKAVVADFPFVKWLGDYEPKTAGS